MDSQNPQELDGMPILDLIMKIKAGAVNPKLLYKGTRQLCVETMFVEGYHISKIAGLFQVSDRTIRRDIADIRERNAVAPSPEMTRALLGELVANSRYHSASLRRIARREDAYPDEKARAEYLAWRVGKELVDRLCQVGFLVAAGEPLKTDAKKKEKEAPLTPKQKELTELCRALPPMEREKLIERILREMLKLDEQAREGGQEEPGPGTEEAK